MRFGLAQVKVAIISALRNCKVSLGPNTEVPLPIDPCKMAYTSKFGIHLRMELL